MKTLRTTERILGYAFRVSPSTMPLQHPGLSWSSVSVDTDFWPLAIDPDRNRRVISPFPELWSDLDEALSHFHSSSDHVLVAISLPYFPGCEGENGYRDFIKLTEGFGLTGKEDNSWINARPILTNSNAQCIQMGYDISYAGAFKSTLLVEDVGNRWGIDISVSGERTAFGLLDSFWDAHAYAVAQSEQGRRVGWPIEETRLWPLGLWWIKEKMNFKEF